MSRHRQSAGKLFREKAERERREKKLAKRHASRAQRKESKVE